MSWQMLKLKRLKLKSEIPKEVDLIRVIELNGQAFHFFSDKDGRFYFHNCENHKWSELINDIWEE